MKRLARALMHCFQLPARDIEAAPPREGKPTELRVAAPRGTFAGWGGGGAVVSASVAPQARWKLV